MISDLIQKKGGLVVDSPGDNVLAEFASVVDALESAVEIQREQAVKNIEKPLRAYRVLMEPEQAGKVIGEKGLKRTQRRWAVAAAVILVDGALALWNFYLRPPPIEPASKEKMAFPLPDKPSIAVLPFTNMSDVLAGTLVRK